MIIEKPFISIGARVKVKDPFLDRLREIFETNTGLPAEPNHYGTVDSLYDDMAVVVFDDGVAAPYPLSDCEVVAPTG